MSDVHETITFYLAYHIGRENAITADELLLRIHRHHAEDVVPNIRRLLEVIHDMRRAGTVIGSCAAGYFKPKDAGEAHDYVRQVLASRALDLMQTIRAQRRAIATEYGRQLPMF